MAWRIRTRVVPGSRQTRNQTRSRAMARNVDRSSRKASKPGARENGVNCVFRYYFPSEIDRDKRSLQISGAIVDVLSGCQHRGTLHTAGVGGCAANDWIIPKRSYLPRSRAELRSQQGSPEQRSFGSFSITRPERRLPGLRSITVSAA